MKLLPLKFINGNSGYTCDAIEAIEYAMKKGVKIINCSFGGTDNNYALKRRNEKQRHIIRMRCRKPWRGRKRCPGISCML